MSRTSIAVALAVGTSGLLVGLLAGHGLRANIGSIEPHPLDWDGHRWSEFSPPEKDAYLGGFSAGAAASQVYSIPNDSVFDPELLAERLSALRAERELNFPYASNLYRARLHDYYFYIDRRDRPIYRAIAELNFQIQTQQH